jgi:hypothetical protein
MVHMIGYCEDHLTLCLGRRESAAQHEDCD